MGSKGKRWRAGDLKGPRYEETRGLSWEVRKGRNEKRQRSEMGGEESEREGEAGFEREG